MSTLSVATSEYHGHTYTYTYYPVIVCTKPEYGFYELKVRICGHKKPRGSAERSRCVAYKKAKGHIFHFRTSFVTGGKRPKRRRRDLDSKPDQ